MYIAFYIWFHKDISDLWSEFLPVSVPILFSCQNDDDVWWHQVSGTHRNVLSMLHFLSLHFIDKTSVFGLCLLHLIGGLCLFILCWFLFLFSNLSLRSSADLNTGVKYLSLVLGGLLNLTSSDMLPDIFQRQVTYFLIFDPREFFASQP